VKKYVKHHKPIKSHAISIYLLQVIIKYQSCGKGIVVLFVRFQDIKFSLFQFPRKNCYFVTEINERIAILYYSQLQFRNIRNVTEFSISVIDECVKCNLSSVFLFVFFYSARINYGTFHRC
jgi:hypothetical protein